MFDTIIDSVKIYVTEALLPFIIAAFLGDILIQLGSGEALDFARVIQITVTAIVIGALVSILIGALRGLTK